MENILWMWFFCEYGICKWFRIVPDKAWASCREKQRTDHHKLRNFAAVCSLLCYVLGREYPFELTTMGLGDKIACLSTWFRSFRDGIVRYHNSITAFLCPVSEMQYTQMQLFRCILQCWGRKHVQAHSGKKSVICSDKAHYRFCAVKTRLKPHRHVKITCIQLNQLYNNCMTSWIAVKEGCAVNSEESL